MTPAKTATPAPVAETGLVVWEPKVVEMLPAGLTADQVNMLVPTVQVRQINPYLVPDLEMVKLNPAEGAGDVYHSNDMKAGQFAPTARALAKIANVAGIDVLDSRRIDEGRDPDVVEWRVVIEMALPSGQRVRRSGTKRIDLHQLGTTQSAAWLAKAREHLIANAETKALNRAVRSVLSLHGALPLAAYAKPFAILRWVPNMNDPDVRRRMLDNLLPATSAAYGPHASSLQIEAGPAIIDEVGQEAPDDDPVEAEYAQAPDDAPVLDEAPPIDDDGIDWHAELAADRASLAHRLRGALGNRRGEGKPATDDQKIALRALFAGRSGTEVVRGLKAVFDFAGAEPRDITTGQARAILEVAEAAGRDAFLDDWRGLAA